MGFIYHRVQDDMQGNILYPLNELKGNYPEVYEKHMSKYEGRMHVPKQRIPLFDDCLWNDVLFFVSAHPQTIFDARRKAGWPDVEPKKFYKIDPRKLDQSKLGIFLFQPWANPADYTIDNFAAYNYEDLEKYAVIPDKTKEYFKHEFAAGEPYIKLFWRYIPHILYHGSIDISDVEIITAN